ncbi:MAG: carbohydrate ABC transporter permease [Clostridia bacterium]|nr:carbohydrate ABC transporter permease [Clostridia bacterium]MDE7214242.1 carbohydrate ABC transporter permease [Clostridia bacterium]
MKRKIEASEMIFKIIAYVILILFALLCIYPMLYVLGSTFSSPAAVENRVVVLWPMVGTAEAGFTIGFSGEAFAKAFSDNMFWVSYANTLFITFIGTIWCMVYSILGAYALSKKRLLGRHGFNFFLVFTMWFSAGVVPQYMNYIRTGDAMAAIVGAGSMYDVDLKWLIVLAMGMNATNIILLRNAFEGVPSEIEEAARIDGATELQVLWQVYIPMSKATIATVALFFGISRWNGYFWASKVLGESSEGQSYSWPVQVKIRDIIKNETSIVNAYDPDATHLYTEAEGTSVLYAMVVLAIIPILIIYPFIQKYFAKGVNMGGVKE